MLAEVSASSSSELQAGRFRRGDLCAFESVLERVGGVSTTLLLTGRGQNTNAAAVGIAAAAGGRRARTALVNAISPGPHWLDRWALPRYPAFTNTSAGSRRSPRFSSHSSWRALHPTASRSPSSASLPESPAWTARFCSRRRALRTPSSGFAPHMTSWSSPGRPLLRDWAASPRRGSRRRGRGLRRAGEARGRPGRHLKRDLRRLLARFAGLVSYAS